MLAIGVNYDDSVLLTLTEEMPAGTELSVTLTERDGRKRLVFDAPRSVAITRESAETKQPKVECAEKVRTSLRRSRA
jgi:hypothetical protein